MNQMKPSPLKRFQSEASAQYASKKSFERMQLMSMIPLEVDPSTSSHKPPPDIWEQLYKNPFSRFAQMLEYSDSGRPPAKVEANASSEFNKHKITPFKHEFVQQPEDRPEPASYDPIYPSVMPFPVATNMQRKDISSPPAIKSASTLEILERYQSDIRAFDASNVNHKESELSVLDPHEAPDKKIFQTFDHQLERPPFAEAKTLPSEETPIPERSASKCRSFSDQSGRTFEFVRDEGRDYTEKAVEELFHLKTGGNIPRINQQISRYFKAKKSERVEFLSKLAKSQQSILAKLNPKRKVEVVSPMYARGDFSKQVPRGLNLITKPSVLGEPKIPINPEKSLRYIEPKVKVPSMDGRAKRFPSNDADFWTSH